MYEDPDKTVLATKSVACARLFCFYQENVWDVALNGRQIFGRPSDGSSLPPDISVSSSIVSRLHGLFETANGKTYYTSLSHSNGTFAHGRLLQTNEKIHLHDGDILRITGTKNRQDKTVTLIYSTGYHPGFVWKRQMLDSRIGEVVVGRQKISRENLNLQDRSVSRRHASFFYGQMGWAVADLGSMNGILLNGQRLLNPLYLSPFDVINIADYYFYYTGTSLIYQSDEQLYADRKRLEDCLSVWIEERNVWQRFKKKTLLKDIRLDIPSGKLVLILGGSGAGKTTFMNAVMGYEKADGQILYNNQDIYADYERMKYEIGYVPQQSVLRENDTVFDTLLNAAKMRLPATLTNQDYLDAVYKTLDKLALREVEDSLVRKLSGGQNRRLNIAAQYVGDPKLFFLDEPDSGLDSSNGLELMKNLRSIADDGKIVLIISHSPDRAMDLLDLVIILAKGSDGSGHLVYFGSPKDACRFFEVSNLESIVKRINSQAEGGEGLADYFIQKYQYFQEGMG